MQTITNADNADYLVLLENTLAKQDKTEFIYFNQDGAISPSNASVCPV